MSLMDETVLFNFHDKDEKTVQETLTIVYDALNEKGYSAVNQIVGYYIPRHRDARNLVRRHERDEIIEELIRHYIRSTGRDC